MLDSLENCKMWRVPSVGALDGALMDAGEFFMSFPNHMDVKIACTMEVCSHGLRLEVAKTIYG